MKKANGLSQRAAVPCRLLLVDDDPLFGLTMRKIARSYDIPITYCSSVEDIPKLEHPETFTGAIIDIELDRQITGVEVAKYFSAASGIDFPVLLVSSSSKYAFFADTWPSCVRGFENKMAGAERILERTLDLALPRRF